jgi:hypothetical protein
MSGPYKICKHVAADIRKEVAPHLISRTKISEDLAKTLRWYAENDYFNHFYTDPEYETEGGPANLVDKTIQEVEELRSSRERVG